MAVVEREARRILDLNRERLRRHERELDELVGHNGMYPLDSPDMPPPGPDFLYQAAAEGDGSFYKRKIKNGNVELNYEYGEVLHHLYRRALRTPGFTLDVEVRSGIRKTAYFVPGHIWGQYWDEYEKSQQNYMLDVPPVDGPHPADVMIIGKMPWKEEISVGRNFVGATGEVLIRTLQMVRITSCFQWYVTNLIKFMPPDESSTLKKGWIYDCLPLLHQELRIVRPRYILCLGADASKALLGDKFGVGYMEGRVVEYNYPLHHSSEAPQQYHKALVMTVVHPAQVARDQGMARVLERGLYRWSLLLSGARFDLEEGGLDHRCVATLEEAESVLQEAETYFSGKPQTEHLVSWDAEWQGQHPGNEGSYLRTIQMSWRERTAVCFKLRHAGGGLAFCDSEGEPAIDRLVKMLTEFMHKKRAVGHFLVADLEWMEHEGFHLMPSFRVPLHDSDTRLAWQRTMDGEGGADTGMMAHAIEETAQLGLETLTMRYTTCPRYDIALEDWKVKYCKEMDIKKTALDGYGDVPDEILVPYANYDADATLRLYHELAPLLSVDYDGNNCWEAFWESMIIQPTILECHRTGINVDKDRIDDLTVKFMNARDEVEIRTKEMAFWPEFNIRSVQHVKEFLFGERYNGKVSKGIRDIRLRPYGARSLEVKPLIDTGKPPQRWDDIVAKGREREHNPSTNKMVLAILAQDNMRFFDEINHIRDYRFLDQVLKSMLRPPMTDGETQQYILDDDDNYTYEAGLPSCINYDGRVRTHLYPTAETGRWKSARPQLHNISKQRDDDYARLLGAENYKHKLRSVLVAPPGEVLIEADYKGAELYGMALMSGDKAMIEHAERALFPDEGYDEHGKKVPGGKHPHPQYYDIHSNVAVLAFRLPCSPTKAGLKGAGLLRFRTLAKNVIFGIAYGRGAKAIALQAKENKKKGDEDITVEQAQAVIDAIFEMYPCLLPFFDECKKRAIEDRWLCHCFGRLRRFPVALDDKLEGEFERQAMNFPIQGMIASCLDRGVAYLTDARNRLIPEFGEPIFRWQLTIHDAILLRCKPKYVEYLADTLIPWAMCESVPIYPTTLDGLPTGRGPYRLGIDVEVSEHWGEPVTIARCLELGIPERFGKH